MIYVHWIVLTIYTIIAIVTMLTVLLEHRQPAKTIAWILVLTFMPIIGIIIYFFFGRRTRRDKHIWQHSLDQLTKRSMVKFVEQENLQVPFQYKELISLFANQNLSLPFKNNITEIYTSGYDFFFSLISSISKAEKHIHIVTYIIEDDPLGRLIKDTLIDKAHQGIEVRLLYDDVGSWKASNRFFEEMREEGIEVHAFMPVRFPAFTGKVNYRNHRKLIIIDGITGFIGGMNIAMRYIKGSTNWRDTHIKINGNAVYGIQREFLVDWFFADQTLISHSKYYPPINIYPNNTIIQIVTSSPTSQWSEIEQGYLKVILSAKKYIYMESPYFLPTEPILSALCTAALSGVDIRIIVPQKSDSKLVGLASNTYLRQVTKGGVKILLYTNGFNHSKLLVSDDNISTIGSTNIDFRSFENNFEGNAFLYDKQIAIHIKQIFLKDSLHSVSFEDYRKNKKISFIFKLWESIVRLLSPLL